MVLLFDSIYNGVSSFFGDYDYRCVCVSSGYKRYDRCVNYM